MSKYIEIGPLAKDEMYLEDFFSIFSSANILFNGAEPLRPYFISDRHDFSSFRSRSHPVTTEQVSAQRDRKGGKRFEN